MNWLESALEGFTDLFDSGSDDDYGFQGGMIDEDYSGYSGSSFMNPSGDYVGPDDELSPYYGSMPATVGGGAGFDEYGYSSEDYQEGGVFEPYDDRSYLKQAQDYLNKTLGIDPKTAKLIAGFAGAAGDALKGGDNRGGGSARSQRPATPTGRQLGTTRPDKPGIARTAQLAGLSQRAAAAMTAMQKNQFEGVSLADLIAGQGATTPKGQTIANPRGVRNLNVKQTQFV